MPSPTDTICRPFLAVAVSFVFATAGTESAPGQAVENENLTALREKFETGLEKRLAPLKARAVRDLEVLENQRAIRGDYEGAIRARDRHISMSDQTADPDAETTEEKGIIRLSVANARTAGNTVTLDRRRNAIVGFKRPGHSASWDVMKVKPGWYKVLATYGCAESFEERVEKNDEDDPGKITRSAGGTFRFFEDTALLVNQSEPIVKTVVPTGGWDRLVTRNIGKLKITGTRATLTLEVLEAESEGIMYLHGIILVPTVAPGEVSIALNNGTDAPGELQKLRSQYEQKIAFVTSDAFTRFTADLRKIEEKYIEAENLDGALAARKAREQAESRFHELNPR